MLTLSGMGDDDVENGDGKFFSLALHGRDRVLHLLSRHLFVLCLAMHASFFSSFENEFSLFKNGLGVTTEKSRGRDWEMGRASIFGAGRKYENDAR